MRIEMASIFVDDQEKAKRFYTEVLGFQVESDADYGTGERWLTVVSPEAPTGTQLLLGLAKGPAIDFQRSVREAGTPAISLTTDDIDADFQRLREAGVRFTVEPQKQHYGGVDAVFDDTCGNLINLHRR